jgi:uncharacterized protein (DUF934 family)
MAKLLSTEGIAADDRTWVEADAPSPVAGPAIYPLAYWLAHRDVLPADSGVWLTVDAEPAEFAEVIPTLALIAIFFDSFADGRGLSLAVQLRSRFGFRGELRAAGAVHEDLVHYMHRCGFDSYLMSDDRDHDTARRALGQDRATYQGSVITPEPAFRRVARS